MVNSKFNKNTEGVGQLLKPRWRIYALIALVGFIISGILSYGFYTGDRMSRVYAPLVDATMEIKLEATIAHLWFEEIVTGDRYEELETVWEHLDEADWYAKAMLEGGENPEGIFIPLDNNKMRREIRDVQEKLMAFRDITEKRIAAKETSGIGTPIDQHYDKVFRDFFNQADQVETSLQKIMTEDLSRFRYIQVILIAISLLLFLSIIMAFYRFDHRRIKDLVSIKEMTKNLELQIDERKKAEEALRESEEKYRTILESMEEGYYEVDLAGNFTFVNDAMCKIRGYSRDELMGMSNREYMTEKTAKEVFKAFNNVYTTGKPAKNLEWETIRKDGTKGYVETSASLVKNSAGESVGFRGVVRDISEKHRLEAQLQQAHKMESIGTLAGGIAHNFNNLLMGIQGNASIMLLDIDSSNPRHKNLKNIEKLVENGAKLTAQLIGYAREGSYQVKPISLNQLVKETSDTFGMTKKEITVHRELSQKLYGIEADQGQIEQFLLNLYVNAADAMPGIGDLFLKTINVADKDITGKPYEVKPGNYVLLTVRDTGGGMDKETKERIFDPFFTTKGLAVGTGLGMASAYGTIKGHGGYIDVDSEKGKGTTFNIYLPATEKMIEEKKVLSDELVTGKGTVLLVDDEEMVLEAGEVLLNHLGYEVLLAENGQEALELYRKHQDKIDLVLLDMVMPVMGGGEAFDRMKEINTNVKVLLSSGYSIEGEAKDILERGCDAFIQKPFKLEQLSQKLRGILDKK